MGCGKTRLKHFEKAIGGIEEDIKCEAILFSDNKESQVIQFNLNCVDLIFDAKNCKNFLIKISENSGMRFYNLVQL